MTQFSNFLNTQVSHYKKLYDFQNINRENKLRVLYFNAISLRNKYSDITQFIDSFNCKIHVVVITETRLHEEENKFYNINNYVAYHSNRKKSDEYGRGSGVAIYVHNELCSTFILEECIENKYHFLIVKLIHLDLYLIATYRSPKSNTESLYIHNLENLLVTYKNAYVVGDMNLDLLNRNDEQIRLYKEIIHLNGFFILNKIHSDYATRVTEISSTIIDHILCNKLNYKFDLLLDDVFFSDHRYFFVLIDSNQTLDNRENTFTKSVLSYKNINGHRFWNDLSNIESFNDLIKNTASLINDNKINYVCKKNGNNPWVTSELLELIKERNRYFRYSKKYKNNIYASEQYKKFKNLAVNLNRKLKSEYFEKKLHESIETPYKFWQFLKYA